MSRLLNVYWAVLAITAVFAVLFKDDRKKFVISAAVVHIFVCGFRYELAGGDLHAYKRMFLTCAGYSWADPNLWAEGRNTLFFMFNKLVANLTNNNFQIFLFLLSFISILSISIVIYRYSESPLISYLMWNCFGFYVFTFSGIKQGLAMSFVMIAGLCIFERKRLLFYLFAVMAGFVHRPAFVFLPAFELCRAKKLRTIAIFYIIVSAFVLFYRNQIINIVTEFYYEGGLFEEVDSYGIGGKTIMMVALLTIGTVLCNMKNDMFRSTFILMATASILQMFSVYNNVFTRLADYYFQFILLYAPLILMQPHSSTDDRAFLNFNKQSQRLLSIGFVCLALIFYYRLYFAHSTVPGVIDMIGKFKFFWQ